MNVRKLTTASLLIALGVITAHAIFIPVGVAKAFPMQHAINVIAAVLLGPHMAVAIAFLISLLRNILGTGSLLAFPGSIFGALLAGYLFSKTKKINLAVLGECFGTGVLGGLSAMPIANLFMGFEGAGLFFVIPFAASSIVGAIIGFAVLKILLKSKSVDFLLKGGEIS